MSQNNSIKELNIKSLFCNDRYVIPIYQRNYAWTEAEIIQLIQDIVDYSAKDSNQIYYIGSLIVFERKEKGLILYETIDGQQRLTTLTILLNAIKNDDEFRKGIANFFDWYTGINLTFDSREISTNTLQYLFNNEISRHEEYNNAIKQAYDDSIKGLKRILRENNLPIKKFCDYLINKVCILRVSVPPDTDLNHYFEIMNSRGEQLEKHEILKAKFIDTLSKNVFSDKYINAFNTIWEACSNMERYIQFGFTVPQRDALFGKESWDRLTCTDFDSVSDLLLVLNKNDTENDISQTIDEIINSSTVGLFSGKLEKKEDEQDRFNTVVSFSNFLLHVLRVQTREDIPLDDKRLLDIFQDKIGNVEFAKEFGFSLLKCKILFDKYIIKRESLKGSEHWSLKRMKLFQKGKPGYVNTFGEEENEESENKDILMLLSMFHVSNPSTVYKHWLNGALNFLFYTDNITSLRYKNYLENMAISFLYDRFLAVLPIDYYEMIYKNGSVSQNNDINTALLNSGTSVENFIFNYLDYILWKSNKNEYANFEYTFRSSVEHYYPQDPIEKNQQLEKEYLDDFGNLCLISNHINSRLSNYMPRAKKDHYANNPIVESIKQRKMMKEENWGPNEIIRHGQEMKKLLLSQKQIKGGTALHA
ncbi:hypothetical protein AGMMS4952_13960 [Spirochaetia bacterium]|nr:hypothetical protein AGMMS4952_13960 [Spirochaetia bacterium]